MNTCVCVLVFALSMQSEDPSFAETHDELFSYCVSLRESFIHTVQFPMDT